MGKEEKDVEIEVREVLEEGKYDATIQDVRYRDEPFEYVDVVFDIDGKVMVKAGYPAHVSKRSQLGQLLEKAGMDIQGKKSIKLSDIKNILVGRNVKVVLTYDDNGFMRVVKESIKFE